MAFIIQMSLSICIKLKQGMVISVAVMNIILVSNNVGQRRHHKYQFGT